MYLFPYYLTHYLKEGCNWLIGPNSLKEILFQANPKNRLFYKDQETQLKKPHPTPTNSQEEREKVKKEPKRASHLIDKLGH